MKDISWGLEEIIMAVDDNVFVGSISFDPDLGVFTLR